MKLKGYRTIIVSFLTILFGVLATIDWGSFLNDPKAGIVALIVGIVMGICRYYTTTPIFDAKHPAEIEVEEVKKDVKV